MAIRKVVLIGDPVLRQKAAPVQDFGPAFQELVDDMIETMRDAPGVGLAAPQVGISKRLIIVETPESEEEPASGKLFAVANAEIMKASREEEEGEEGCLSIPGYIGDVWRAKWIIVKGQNRHGKSVRLKVHGFVARVFQHEIDHTDGILYIDHIEEPGKLWKLVEKENGEIVAVPVTGLASPRKTAARTVAWG